MTQKVNLVKSLRQYYAETTQVYGVFDTMPTTFLLVASSQDDGETSAFMHRFKELAQGYGSKNERMPLKHCTENMWVVKPAALNQGRGISVLDKMGDILDCVYSQ